jgi:crotonobetainyl-CoA:carnitine CoA-transferase CaiB-like acyl-CoA transferase
MVQMFKGLKVVDLSTVLAGPSVATFFAELGAEVIKIENPRTCGDVTRSWKLSSEEQTSQVSAYFSAVNFGKSYVWLNLADPNEHERLFGYLDSADIVITNFKEGDAEKFGLNYKILSARNPKIIYATIEGYSSDKQRVAYDVVLQAETGFMHMNGEASGPATKMPVALIDVLAAHQLKEAILIALYKRNIEHKGSHVWVSLEKAALASLANQATNYLMAGHVPQRMGSLHPNIAPYGETFAGSDGKWMVLAIGSEKQFHLLCEALNLEALIHDARFGSNQERVKHREDLAAFLKEKIALQPREHWLTIFNEKQIPAGAIRTMDEVMAQPVAQSMWLEETINGVTTKRMSSVAFDMKS